MIPPTGSPDIPSSLALPRSYLFVPGDQPHRFDKAWASLADAIILDLEDAIEPAAKDAARKAVASWLQPSTPVWIRVNAADTPWFAADLQLLERPGVAGIMLPKTEFVPRELQQMAERLSIGLIPLIETAAGIQAARSVACLAGVTRLAFGALDLMADLAVEDEDAGLLPHRCELILASRLADLPAPIDSVTVDVRDEQVLRKETTRSQRLGFGAKLCIHPAQVQPVHEVLAPSENQRAVARRITDAMANGAVAVIDGKMVDRPVLLWARRVAAAPPPDASLRR